MTEHHHCSCGFAAPTDDELTDHLLDVFSLASDTAPDGKQHAEAIAGTCLCGYKATSLGDLDQHILAAYTPPNATAPDGIRHVRSPTGPGLDG